MPSVKSLLVRARISLAEAAEARKLSCEEVRLELGEVAEGLAKLSPPARRHVRDCERCRVFKKQLKDNNHALAAILPVGPLLLSRSCCSPSSARPPAARGTPPAAPARASAPRARAAGASARLPPRRPAPAVGGRASPAACHRRRRARSPPRPPPGWPPPRSSPRAPSRPTTPAASTTTPPLASAARVAHTLRAPLVVRSLAPAAHHRRPRPPLAPPPHATGVHRHAVRKAAAHRRRRDRTRTSRPSSPRPPSSRRRRQPQATPSRSRSACR